MNDKREPLLVIAVGKRGIGKTYATKQIINQYVKGNLVKGIPGRKMLIIDVNNEFVEYRRISPKDVTLFSVHPKIECRRISCIHPDGTPMGLNEIQDMLERVLSDFRGGGILIEDISKYVGDNPSVDLVGHLCTIRHKDTDVIVHFQMIGKAGQPKIKANMNVLRFHKTLDTVERHKNKFEEYTEILKIAEKLVNKRYENDDIRFYCYVNFDTDKISGKFSKAEFMDTLTEYIQENERDTITKLLNKKDREGRPIYKSYRSALEKCEKDLYDLYYGN